MIKIGIPEALLYHYYITFWQPFFENLGFQVVVSGKTNKDLMNKGVKESVSEICVPIKIFTGHVLKLMEMNVDYIFIPRMKSIRKHEFFCPKFMGLPDILRYGLAGIQEKILSCTIESPADDVSYYKNYLELAGKLHVEQRLIKKAATQARKNWLLFRTTNKKGYTALAANEILQNNLSLQKVKVVEHTNQITIGLLGYVYNIYDEFVNMNILNKLKELKIDYLTFDMLEESIIEKEIAKMPKPLFWTFSNKILGAGYHFFRSGEVDGVIHLTAFGCGPDSFMGRLFELESDRTDIPFMNIRIDEHTGENHLQTRIEAFTDMLKRKKSGFFNQEGY